VRNNQIDKRLLRRRDGEISSDVAFIAAEMLAGFEKVNEIGRAAVSFFGSARVGEESAPTGWPARPARLFGGVGYAIVTGGGPGVMEAANRGCQEGGGCPSASTSSCRTSRGSIRTATSR